MTTVKKERFVSMLSDYNQEERDTRMVVQVKGLLEKSSIGLFF